MEDVQPPINHGESPPFHCLIIGFFDPLVDRFEELKASTNLPTAELKVKKINEFINRWRKNVGDDIYPAFRLSKSLQFTLFTVRINALVLPDVSVLPVSAD